MARPPTPPELKRETPLKVMVTAGEYEELTAAAVAQGLDRSAWARPILLKAARELSTAKAPSATVKKTKKG